MYDYKMNKKTAIKLMASGFIAVFVLEVTI